MVSGGETCDDGNTVDSDACTNACAAAACGDGITRSGVEACDDGNGDDTDGCTNTCALPSCGDGRVQAPEPCDDGNRDDTDDCSATCLPATCGDTHVRAGQEACDDGNTDDGDDCLATCQKARCGDGSVQRLVEACDDGNANDVDGCDNACRLPVCGDGKKAGAEACDDGNTSNSDACLATCALATCGDGFVRQGVEACDDGNTSNADGCVENCRLASCGDGHVREALEGCDDANSNDLDACDNACRLPVCGDGKKAGFEACDLGASNGDRPAFLITQPSGTRVATNPMVRKQSIAQFYSYSSASSHTGFEAVGESRIYLFADALSGRLSLVLTQGIDRDSSGLVQPDSQVNMTVSGLPPSFTVEVADDSPAEFFKTGPTTAAGKWVFNANSDGAALGGLPFPGTWKITVTPDFVKGITTWGWVRDDLQRIPLKMTEPITLEALDTGTACRADCTVPTCGDGKLDASEICDDGNTLGGDGCAANCKAF